MPEDKLFIGMNADTGNAVYITTEQLSTHLQIVGSTGTGKSKFLEHLIRESIKAGTGICLLDPHGFLFSDTAKWLQAIDWPKDKIILVDPSSDDFATGFNPLKFSVKDLSFAVDAMVRACAKVWGGEDTDRTPLLKRCLRIIFHALAERRLSLLEAQYLTSPTRKIARQFLTKDIADPIILEQWDYFNSPQMTPKLFYDEMGSTINRLMEFLAAARLRNVLGQIQSSLDFQKIMDEQYIVLVNLSTGRSVSQDNARLLGSLIVNDLFLTATSRKPNSPPFHLFIDEAGLYVNEDVARILDEGRKFGLHLILAHQHLAQLKKAGEDVYHSVMTDAKTKVVFGGLSPEDARIMAELMYLGEINLDEVQHILDKPVVTRYIIRWLKSYSQGEAFGESRTDSYSESRGQSTNDGWSNAETNAYPVPDLFSALCRGEMLPDSGSISSMRGFSHSTVIQSGSSSGSGFTESYHKSSQRGKSEALEPILETMPTKTYSLQDQIWKAMRTLVNQPSRYAILKLPDHFTKRIIVPFVHEFPTSSDETIWHYKERCNQLCSFNKPVAEAQKEIEDRRRWLLGGIREYELSKQTEPREFKQPKKVATKKSKGQGTAKHRTVEVEVLNPEE